MCTCWILSRHKARDVSRHSRCFIFLLYMVSPDEAWPYLLYSDDSEAQGLAVVSGDFLKCSCPRGCLKPLAMLEEGTRVGDRCWFCSSSDCFCQCMGCERCPGVEARVHDFSQVGGVSRSTIESTSTLDMARKFATKCVRVFRDLFRRLRKS